MMRVHPLETGTVTVRETQMVGKSGPLRPLQSARGHALGAPTSPCARG